jgi:hypothetical protein
MKQLVLRPSKQGKERKASASSETMSTYNDGGNGAREIASDGIGSAAAGLLPYQVSQRGKESAVEILSSPNMILSAVFKS